MDARDALHHSSRWIEAKPSRRSFVDRRVRDDACTRPDCMQLPAIAVYEDGPCSTSARASASIRNSMLPMRTTVTNGMYQAGE